MTDKEMVLHLCSKLGLAVEDVDEVKFGSHFGQVYATSKNYVILGHGEGQEGNYTSFTFDDDGNILNHGVWTDWT